MTIARDPGPAIKELLRREINFGCPVIEPNGQGCGSPILTYHHFDPPWASGRLHNPDGMIALCQRHHDLADGGHWTNQQLRNFKHNPFITDHLKFPWPSSPERLLVQAGPGIVVGHGSPLRLYGKPVLGFHHTDVPAVGGGTIAFDAFIENRSERPWLKIVDGWVDVDVSTTRDFCFSPQARTLVARCHDGTRLQAKYRRMSNREFLAWWEDLQHRRRFGLARKFLLQHDVVDSDGKVPLMTVTGTFITNHVAVGITQRRMDVQLLKDGWNNKSGFMRMNGTVVDEEHCMLLKDGDGTEFFRFG